MIAWFAKLALLGVSSLFALLLLEVAARSVFHPIDYLLPVMESDPYLNHRIAGGSGGHDEWGFRNYTRPDRVEWVAVGDSQTYGVAARSFESWPAQLEERVEGSVYNMGLGGFGPLHYLHLVREQAPRLEPHTIIVGLYFGNDFMDVINLSYRNEHWADYRMGDLPGLSDVGGFLVETSGAEPGRFLGGLRLSLARKSVIYRVLTQSPLFDGLRGGGSTRPTATPRALVGGDRRTILDPVIRQQLVDPEDARIRAATEITKRAFREMQAECRSRGIRMVVLLIPTKELVHANLLATPDPEMQELARLETALRGELLGFLETEAIAFVDPLLPLQQGAREQSIYPVNDGHPNAIGYSILAKTIAERIPASAPPDRP